MAFSDQEIDHTKLTQGMFKELGYAETTSAPYLDHVKKGIVGKINLPVAEFGPTFVFKPTDNEFHCMTLLTLQEGNNKIPVFSSYFGKKREDGKYQLDEPALDLHIPAMFMNFVLVVIRKHPCQIFQEGREELLKGMPQDGKPSALAHYFQLKAAKAMMNEQLESYGRTGVPLDKCNA